MGLISLSGYQIEEEVHRTSFSNILDFKPKVWVGYERSYIPDFKPKVRVGYERTNIPDLKTNVRVG